jgi:sec-independent protein translocase protein TatB
VFDIGFQELIIIFFVALLVFGPEKLPEVARTLGKWVIDIRNGIQNTKMQMESEFQESKKTRGEEQKMDHAGEDKKSEETQSSEEKKEEG